MKTHPTKDRPRKKKENETIPWREAFKGLIEKYSETGLMIKGSRAKEGMTQKQLAEILGVLPHHISEMEHGKRPVSKKMARRLAEIFHTDYRIFL